MKDPIVEGAYYEREDGQIVGPAAYDGRTWWLSGRSFDAQGNRLVRDGRRLTRRVWPVYSDPVEVVAELRKRKVDQWAEALCKEHAMTAGKAVAFGESADLVAEKLGLKEP